MSPGGAICSFFVLTILHFFIFRISDVLQRIKMIMIGHNEIGIFPISVNEQLRSPRPMNRLVRPCSTSRNWPNLSNLA